MKRALDESIHSPLNLTNSTTLTASQEPNSDTQQYTSPQVNKLDLITKTLGGLISYLKSNKSFEITQDLTTGDNKKLGDDLVKKYIDIFEKNNLSTEDFVTAIRYLKQHSHVIDHATLGRVTIGNFTWYLYNDIFKSIFNNINDGKNVDHILDSLSGFKFPRSTDYLYQNKHKTYFINLIYSQLNNVGCDLSKKTTKQLNWTTKQSKIAEVLQNISILWHKKFFVTFNGVKPFFAKYNLVAANQDNNLNKSPYTAEQHQDDTPEFLLPTYKNPVSAPLTSANPIQVPLLTLTPVANQHLTLLNSNAEQHQDNTPEFLLPTYKNPVSAPLTSTSPIQVPLLTLAPLTTQQIPQQQQLAQKDHQIAQQQQQLAQKDHQIAQQQQQLAQKDHQIAQQQQQSLNKMLISAIQNKENIPIIEFILKQGADLNTKDTNGKNACLYTACESGNLEFLKLIENKGFDLAKSIDNFIYLRAVCKSGNLELVKYFENKGFDLASKSIYSFTYLQTARNFEKNNVVEHLSSKKIGIDTTTGPLAEPHPEPFSLGLAPLTTGANNDLTLHGEVEQMQYFTC